MKLLLLFFIPLLVCVADSNAQGGCKDPAATNYNPSALYNDGSCTYSTTNYTPPVKVDPISNTLVETSGLQMAGDFLWSFNDGGNAAAIYRLDTTTGNILQTVNLQGATNIDWEDIGFDGTYFYIGDFGNNATGIRTDLKIYKFPLGAIPDYVTDPTATISSALIEVIHFSYSTQTDFSTSTSNNTKYDCEAMVVDGGQIHLFSKNWVEINTVHYVVNGVAAGNYSATPVDTLATGYLVTGADKVPHQNIAVLLGYQTSGFYNHFMHLLSDFSGNQFFNGNRRRIDLPNVFTMGQAEGICLRNSNYGYISNERISSPFTVTQKLRSFNLQSFVPSYVALPAELLSFKVKNVNTTHQVSWNFSAPAKNLKLLHSKNGIDFKVLHEYFSSGTGFSYHQPEVATNCYKLEWQMENASVKSSNIICSESKFASAVSNIMLYKNGSLSFIASEPAGKTYSFKLFTTDGRLLSATTERVINNGTYTIKFGKPLSDHQLLILQIVNDKEQKSILLRVQE